MANEESGELLGGNSPSGNGKKLLERAWDALMAAGFADAVARRYVSWCGRMCCSTTNAIRRKWACQRYGRS